MSNLPFEDIQGFILRGYAMPLMRHIVLRFGDPAAARRFLGALAPQITTAVAWQVKPDWCLNIGLTFEGLKALGLSQASLGSFPLEFAQGAVARAAVVGDVGANAPENWKPPFASPGVHAILFLAAALPAALEAATGTLRGLFGAHGISEPACLDGANLPGSVAHFGFRDGFSQPNVAGAPATGGSFLLGYQSSHPGLTYPFPQPDALGRNGSFLAYRVLQQDCAGFESFLRDSAPAIGLSSEMLAAKLCGRWRNGVPLALSPHTDTPQPVLADDQMNNFDYAPTPAFPNGADDGQGLSCPLGSHIRRANPRSSRVAGGGGTRHRLMRRGLPYGPPYDPARPDDGIERGLLGIFICASLLDQFEFLMSQWIDSGDFAGLQSASKDPIMGNNDPATSTLAIPTASGTRHLSGFSQFVTTRGAAYCFLPSISALKYLQAA